MKVNSFRGGLALQTESLERVPGTISLAGDKFALFGHRIAVGIHVDDARDLALPIVDDERNLLGIGRHFRRQREVGAVGGNHRVAAFPEACRAGIVEVAAAVALFRHSCARAGLEIVGVSVWIWDREGKERKKKNEEKRRGNLFSGGICYSSSFFFRLSHAFKRL